MRMDLELLARCFPLQELSQTTQLSQAWLLVATPVRIPERCRTSFFAVASEWRFDRACVSRFSIQSLVVKETEMSVVNEKLWLREFSPD